MFFPRYRLIQTIYQNINEADYVTRVIFPL